MTFAKILSLNRSQLRFERQHCSRREREQESWGTSQAFRRTWRASFLLIACRKAMAATQLSPSTILIPPIVLVASNARFSSLQNFEPISRLISKALAGESIGFAQLRVRLACQLRNSGLFTNGIQYYEQAPSPQHQSGGHDCAARILANLGSPPSH